RARGVVTYAGAGNSFYLQDSSRGIQVFPRETLRPIPLETIDVVGFPEPGAFSPVLRDADWRPAASTNVPAPLRVPIREATRYDGRLITIEGRLTEISDRDQETILTLEDGTFRSQAHLSDKASPKWRLGSVVRATGVCSVEIGDWESFVAHRRPVGFSLLVQNSSAIEVVKSAPWLTLNRLAWLLAFLGLGLCCSFGAIWWQAKLRLREATRTRDAAQAQFSAVLSERTRIAREIHDTLAQGLTGISAQLEVLNNRIHLPSSNWARHLDIARELVKGSLDEARRSVWNLRSQALEEAGLSEALDRLGRQLIEGSGVALNSTVAGEPRILPSEVENNLLRIGQEAITNAVRHAEASLISVTLSYLANQVRLEVCDDGKGVDLNHRAPSVQGGFGLAGMQERAHAMHASLTIVRGETRGTRVEITIPHV
ncbi:MAG TPA: sensor histidine kinase, partial [Lacunisphaera sp.]